MTAFNNERDNTYILYWKLHTEPTNSWKKIRTCREWYGMHMHEQQFYLSLTCKPNSLQLQILVCVSRKKDLYNIMTLFHMIAQLQNITTPLQPMHYIMM